MIVRCKSSESSLSKGREGRELYRKVEVTTDHEGERETEREGEWSGRDEEMKMVREEELGMEMAGR